MNSMPWNEGEVNTNGDDCELASRHVHNLLSCRDFGAAQ